MAVAVGGNRSAAPAPAVAQSLVVPVQPGSATERALDALLECALRWGIQKTTVEDVARTAGISRATIYRLFPGGKRSMVQAAALIMVQRLADAAATEASGAADLADALTAVIISAERFLSDDEALQFLMQHDAASLEAQLALGGFDQLLAASGELIGPILAPHAGSAERGVDAAVWAARMVISHQLNPSDGPELSDPQVARRLVDEFFLPGFAPATDRTAVRSSSTNPPSTNPSSQESTP